MSGALDRSPIYTLGGLAAALLALLTVAHAAVFAAAGLPASVDDWFALFHRSPTLGLLAFESLMVLFVVVSVPLALALFVALRPTHPTLALLYLAVTLVGVIAFIRARPASEMLAVATAYGAAPDGMRAAYLAAGEAMLATFHGTAFWVSYVLGSLGGLLLGVAMLHGRRFGRAAPSLRIASSVLDFGLFVPGIGLLLSLGSVFCLLLFHILVARRLLLGRVGSERMAGLAYQLPIAPPVGAASSSVPSGPATT
ncbi:MAG TPA: hypothetical protein VFX49_10630 [Chloroflexota bacterium]|nr:hypothetical protein [Chloroflexota bacterium]